MRCPERGLSRRPPLPDPPCGGPAGCGSGRHYDAEEQNDVDGHFLAQTRRGAAFRAVCIVARLAKGVDHSLRRASPHLIPESRRRGPEGFFNSLLEPLGIERAAAVHVRGFDIRHRFRIGIQDRAVDDTAKHELVIPGR